MPPRPQPTRNPNGRDLPNPRFIAGTGVSAPVVHRMAYYGNIDHMKYVVKFQEQDRKRKNPLPDRYTRTVEAIRKKFGCAESTAKMAISAVQNYTRAVFAARMPHLATELAADFDRLAQKAEAAGDYASAVRSRRELGQIAGSYAPVKVEVEHTVGPSLQTQLKAVLGILSPEARRGMELALAEIEQAKAEGRLQLASGDEEPPTSGNGVAAVVDADDAEFTEVAR